MNQFQNRLNKCVVEATNFIVQMNAAQYLSSMYHRNPQAIYLTTQQKIKLIEEQVFNLVQEKDLLMRRRDMVKTVLLWRAAQIQIEDIDQALTRFQEEHKKLSEQLIVEKVVKRLDADDDS